MSTEPITRLDLDPPLDLGDGRSVISCELTFYRVSVGSEVQAFPAKGEATPENALDDIVTNPPDAPALPVPQEVTPLQMRRALNTAGLRATVEAAVASAPQDVRDAWEFATAVRRDDPILGAMAVALDKTSAEVDDLFRLASNY